MEQIFSPNFNSRPKGKVIDTIIIHYTEIDRDKTIEFFTCEKREVSSHYLITKKGELIHFVSPEERAWHAGKSYWKGIEGLNDNSIGIEIENDGMEDFLEVQYEILISLIKQLKSQFLNISDNLILGHSDIAPYRKDDPGERFQWERMYKHGIGMYHDIRVDRHNKVIASFGDNNIKVRNCQKLLLDFGYDIQVDGFYGYNTERVVKAFKTHFCREKIDNIWDEYALSVIESDLEKNK